MKYVAWLPLSRVGAERRQLIRRELILFIYFCHLYFPSQTSSVFPTFEYKREDKGDIFKRTQGWPNSAPVGVLPLDFNESRIRPTLFKLPSVRKESHCQLLGLYNSVCLGFSISLVYLTHERGLYPQHTCETEKYHHHLTGGELRHFETVRSK